ncbi:hypothetical protein Tco_0774385 [Tanacetum coccineum]|uniref:Gag-Pol polyprotein n=1 Tax=Tanacetum coccineum TaxID=301880 RepID=A0ABQ4ZNC5_9ASTR
MHEKTTTPRSCLGWKPTGRIFKTVGLRWVPTGKIFTSSTTKVDCEPPHGSIEDITNIYECKQTLDVSVGTPNFVTDHINEPSSSKLVPNVVPSTDKIDPSLQELELLFSLIYEEYFHRGNHCVSGSSALPDNVQLKYAQPTLNFKPYEFINPFALPDHPLEQVRGNPSKHVQTRRQLATDPEMCMFALTVSTVEPKNIKEAMADHVWIDVMQEELHQFDRLKVWELVDKPFGKTVINLKMNGRTRKMKMIL